MRVTIDLPERLYQAALDAAAETGHRSPVPVILEAVERYLLDREAEEPRIDRLLTASAMPRRNETGRGPGRHAGATPESESRW